MTKQQAVTAIIVCLISLAILLGYGYLTYQEYTEIQARSPELEKLVNYNIPISNDTISPYLADPNTPIATISELLEVGEEVSAKLQERKQLALDQTKYYNLFLRNIYLPSLNVWKDPYTLEIDPTIIGQKYLDTDPYQDLKLIQYRSDFFRNVGDEAEFNEITDISVGLSSDVDGEHFIIPVEISFTAPNKRSFLLLVNKLSTTSNSVNISLLNEFFFYLIKNIKEFKETEITQLREEYAPAFSGQTLEDEFIIGYHLYQWIKHNQENLLIDDTILNTTIRENVLCDEKTPDPECFYKFREKYRDLPYLAYTIGLLNKENKTQFFEDFLQDLPPIITIKDFNFTKVQNNKTLNATAQVYQGTISLNAYGKNISSVEVDEIATKLGQLCFFPKDDADVVLSPTEALNRVEDKILTLGSSLQLSNVINDLEELNNIFTTIQTEYNELANYNKIVKLFEVYRMLKTADLCDV
ncbi:MAG: hypothetical protein LBD11_04845 [Candidatus Peribacteria bacterium]|jgi:hypothetical protein|nr:hypothetical protein [Candidatus Peribacteria bacterium]